MKVVLLDIRKAAAKVAKTARNRTTENEDQNGPVMMINEYFVTP